MYKATVYKIQMHLTYGLISLIMRTRYEYNSYLTTWRTVVSAQVHKLLNVYIYNKQSWPTIKCPTLPWSYECNGFLKQHFMVESVVRSQPASIAFVLASKYVGVSNFLLILVGG